MRTYLKVGMGLMLCMATLVYNQVTAHQDHSHDGIEGARCVGSGSCRACKNCKYCKHCNSGGSCGVCRR